MNHRTIGSVGPVGSVNRCATQSSPRPATTRGSKTKLESMTESRRPFVEDFNMEHCCSGVTAALMAFSANSDSAEAGASRKAYAYPINPPSCVYLG
jgi:hypothetical protein